MVAFGCATLPQPPDTAGVEKITYRYQNPPFCGRCYTVNFVVVSDGTVWIETGHWEGAYRDWRRTRRVVRSTPARFAALQERLAPYRPGQDVENGEDGCRTYFTDDGGAVVEWWNGHERRIRVFDFGCQDDRRMNDVIVKTPKSLPEVDWEPRW